MADPSLRALLVALLAGGAGRGVGALHARGARLAASARVPRVRLRLELDVHDVAEGDVVVAQMGARGLSCGAVLATTGCTLYVQPLVARVAEDDDAPSDAGWVELFADESAEAVQLQGGVAHVFAEFDFGQRPIPSLGGGQGYGAEAVDVWSVRRAEIPPGVNIPLDEKGMAPWTH